MATVLNPYEYVFDVIEILRTGGGMSVAEICEKLKPLRGENSRRRDTVGRILAAGHDRGVFYRSDRPTGKGQRIAPCWGYTSIPFSEPDRVLHTNPKEIGWTGDIRQRLAILEYDRLLIVQEHHKDSSLKDTAEKTGVSLSTAHRAVLFFRVISPLPDPGKYFRYTKSTVLSEVSRRNILKRFSQGDCEKDIREEFSLSSEEYLRVRQFFMAESTPEAELVKGKALVQSIKEKMKTNNRWEKAKGQEAAKRSRLPSEPVNLLAPRVEKPISRIPPGAANSVFSFGRATEAKAA